MFWKRTSRHKRRQRVMEELIDLEPAERRVRLNQAVTEGDVRADEMELLLRTANRLDDLRIMDIPSIYRNRPVTELIGVPMPATVPSRQGSLARRPRRVVGVNPKVVVVDPAQAEAIRVLEQELRDAAAMREPELASASRRLGPAGGDRPEPVP